MKTSPGNCNKCGKVCALANADSSCVAGKCAIASCNPGFYSCDNNQNNGCETDVMNSARDCGSCSNNCAAAPKVKSATCASGSCVISTCNTGFGNCNGNVTNGCETSIASDIYNCGACGTSCMQQHVDSASCGGPEGGPYTCTITACEQGWLDCDSDTSTGCEVQGDACPLPCALHRCHVGFNARAAKPRVHHANGSQPVAHRGCDHVGRGMQTAHIHVD
uniref:Tryptophan synthase alpha chain n=1 Tax=Tetradesmus obliquus TaxID=3088 RepID=A0A383VJN3_TETOB|eukprot:jgi/Sobl393_1/19889/SZX64586.1